MDLRLVSFFLCFPCVLLLPTAVRRVNHSFDAPASFDFWLGVVGIVGCIAMVEWGLHVAEEIWKEEVRRHPPDWRGAKPNPVRLLCRAILVLTQVSGVMMYAT